MGKRLDKFKKSDWLTLQQGIIVEGFEDQPITQIAVGTSEDNESKEYITEYFFEDILEQIACDNKYKIHLAFEQFPLITVTYEGRLVQHNHLMQEEIERIMDCLEYIDSDIIMSGFADMKVTSFDSEAPTPATQILKYKIQDLCKQRSDYQIWFLYAAVEEYLDKRAFSLETFASDGDNNGNERDNESELMNELANLEESEWISLLTGIANPMLQTSISRNYLKRVDGKILQKLLLREAARRQLIGG